MAEWVTVGGCRLACGDCRGVLPALTAGGVDAVVTDPPAGIAFMGKEWDDFRRSRNLADVGRGNVFGRTSAKGPEYGRRRVVLRPPRAA
jgi:DNA modification methylase